MNRKIMKLQQIADETEIPINTLRWLRAKGVGGPPTWKLAGRVVAYEDEVMAWIDEQRSRAVA